MLPGATAQTKYICTHPLNLYKTAELKGLVTQAAVGRYLGLVQPPSASEHAITDPKTGARYVCLCEDDYPGWIAPQAWATLKPARDSYRAPMLNRAQIEPRLPAVIDFTHRAMAAPNVYLWGGTIGPNYDCSGLMQAAFASVGIWLPRDSYQQEAFTRPIGWDDLQPGDLVFFGTPERTKHVALYLGDGAYIHSSGQEQGRNGIGIDSLTNVSHPVSRAYHAQLRRPGRVMHSYVSSRKGAKSS